MMTNSGIGLWFEDSLHKSNIGHISNAKSEKRSLFCFVMVQKILHHWEPKGENEAIYAGFSYGESTSSVFLVQRQNGFVSECVTHSV